MCHNIYLLFCNYIFISLCVNLRNLRFYEMHMLEYINVKTIMEKNGNKDVQSVLTGSDM